MGPENAEIRSTLMDAVEAVMREQGYAALSVRSIGARAGLKFQIVFYYFESMDDLLLTTYRRRTQRVVQRTEQALQSERPLHAFWTASSDPSDAALSLEYMAMSNHNQLIRAETIAFGEHLRRIVAERLADRLAPVLPDVQVFTPLAISMALLTMGGILGFEAALGITGGHTQAKLLVEWCLHRLEPETDSLPQRFQHSPESKRRAGRRPTRRKRDSSR